MPVQPGQTQFGVNGMTAGAGNFDSQFSQDGAALPQSFAEYRAPAQYSQENVNSIPPPGFADAQGMPSYPSVPTDLPQSRLTGAPMREAKGKKNLFEQAPLPTSMTQEGRPKDLIFQALMDSQGGADQVAAFNTPVIKERASGLEPHMINNNNKADANKVEVDPGEYIGQTILNGVKEGQGTCTYKNGNMYEGDWKANKRHGKGTMKYSSGAGYDGEWVEGERSGHGVMQYGNGSSYEGQWLRDLKHGYGRFQFATGASYTGQWWEGKMHGQGTYTYKDGQKYLGEFDRGLKNGHGTHIYSNGDQWDGVWVADEPHGAGLYIYFDNQNSKMESTFVKAGDHPQKESKVGKLLRKEDKLRIMTDGEESARNARDAAEQAAQMAAKSRRLGNKILDDTAKLLGLTVDD